MENKRNKTPIGGSFIGKSDNPPKELKAADEQILADTLTKTKREQRQQQKSGRFNTLKRNIFGKNEEENQLSKSPVNSPIRNTMKLSNKSTEAKAKEYQEIANAFTDFSKLDVSVLIEMFQRFDSDDKGHLKPSELVLLFKEIGYENFTEENMKEFIGSVAIVSFKEYLFIVAGMKRKRLSSTNRFLLDQVKAMQSTIFGPLKSGYLIKQGNRIHSWKRRFFILNNSFLLYFKKEEFSAPLGKIVLEDIVSVKIENTNMFIVQTSSRNYLIKASTIQERDSWIECIRNLVEISKRVGKVQGNVKGAAKFEKELTLHTRDLLFYSSRLAQTYLLCLNFSPDLGQHRISLKEELTVLGDAVLSVLPNVMACIGTWGFSSKIVRNLQNSVQELKLIVIRHTKDFEPLFRMTYKDRFLESLKGVSTCIKEILELKANDPIEEVSKSIERVQTLSNDLVLLQLGDNSMLRQKLESIKEEYRYLVAVLNSCESLMSKDHHQELIAIALEINVRIKEITLHIESNLSVDNSIEPMGDKLSNLLISSKLYLLPEQLSSMDKRSARLTVDQIVKSNQNLSETQVEAVKIPIPENEIKVKEKETTNLINKEEENKLQIDTEILSDIKKVENVDVVVSENREESDDSDNEQSFQGVEKVEEEELKNQTEVSEEPRDPNQEKRLLAELLTLDMMLESLDDHAPSTKVSDPLSSVWEDIQGLLQSWPTIELKNDK